MICPNCGNDNLPGSDECDKCLQDLTHLDRPTAQSRVERGLLEDSVRVLGVSKPITVQKSTTIRDAVSTMMAHKVGSILVVDEENKLLGIFSERDVLMQIVGLRENYESLPVGMFMTENPETVTPDKKLAFALHKMDGGGYRHLPVMENDRPVSVLSVRDMLRYVTGLCGEN